MKKLVYEIDRPSGVLVVRSGEKILHTVILKKRMGSVVIRRKDAQKLMGILFMEHVHKGVKTK